MNDCHAVLLDTISIQDYIFQSNKLKENLGASYLVREIYRSYLACALCQITGRSFEEEWKHLDDWKQSDTDQPDCTKPVDIGYIGGGNALLFFRDESTAGHFIEEWTRLLLVQAPGLMTGVAHHSFPIGPSEFRPRMKNLFIQLKLNKARYCPITLPPRHGITTECARSGVSAELFNEVIEGYVSSGINARIEAATQSKEDLEKEYRDQGLLDDDFCFSNELDDLGGMRGEDSHIAIVHIDGNDIGERFRQASNLKAIRKLSVKIHEATTTAFQAVIKTAADRNNYCGIMQWLGFNPTSNDFEAGCLTEYRITEDSFSKLEQEASFPLKHLKKLRNRGFGTESKLIKALQDELKKKLSKEDFQFSQQDRDLLIHHAEKRRILPVRPIIIGGDDVTFVCDGKLGIYFAEIFIKKFAEAQIEGDALTACAGVAIIKTKYPFYRGYQLAEELCAGAKKKRKKDREWSDASVLDFHVSLGGIAGSLKEIRKRNYGRDDSEDSRNKEVDLLYRPFKIHAKQSLDDHDLDMFLDRVRQLDNDENGLPKNKRHELREVLKLPENARREYVQALEYRGRKLPEIDGHQYHKTLVEYKETPYFDMIEILRFYPLDLRESGGKI